MPSGQGTGSGLRRGYQRARAQGSGIVPGAHPERGEGTKIAGPKEIGQQIAGAAKAIGRALNITGSRKSPTTVHDK